MDAVLAYQEEAWEELIDGKVAAMFLCKLQEKFGVY